MKTADYGDDFMMYLDEKKLTKIAKKEQFSITEKDDMIILNRGTVSNQLVKQLCSSAGLTAAPSID
ncbi:MAG: hypothetical protein KAI17_24780 [Thiotrichaceae bacterium]|nr:hypothetical protein [Thiotrichaceae bacterium]